MKLSDLVTYSSENFNFNRCFVAVTKSTILNQWNKCIGWDVSTDKIIVTSTCDQFILTESNRIKHVTTGNCLIPESQTLNAKLTLTTDCEEPNAIFQYTGSRQMKHVMTGYCVQVYGGIADPPLGILHHYVIHSDCNSVFITG